MKETDLTVTNTKLDGCNLEEFRFCADRGQFKAQQIEAVLQFLVLGKPEHTLKAVYTLLIHSPEGHEALNEMQAHSLTMLQDMLTNLLLAETGNFKGYWTQDKP